MTGLIICFDLDGTLVQPDHSIHPADIGILKRSQKHLFIPSTGRTLSAVKQVFQRNGLFEEQPIPFPLILQNGAVVYLANEVLLRQVTFLPEVQSSLITLLSDYTKVSHLLISLDRIDLLYSDDYANQIIDQLDFDTQTYQKENFRQKLSKVMCISREDQSLDEISMKVKQLGLEAAYSLTHVLEITPPGIDKANGLNILLESLEIQNFVLCAVGDGENDLPILRRANISFAPGSSPAQIQEQVDHIIDVEENGILQPIMEYVTRQ
jgi:Cof subfamily protein (haloacid dehalogenase superfamily)